MLNLCPNCGYNNAQPTGVDYIAEGLDGLPLKNPDGSDVLKQTACARCGYAKTTEVYAKDRAALKLHGEPGAAPATEKAPTLGTEKAPVPAENASAPDVGLHAAEAPESAA